MKKTILALGAMALLSGAAYAETGTFSPVPNAVGINVYQTADTEHNTMTRVTTSGWAQNGDQRMYRDHTNIGVAVSDTYYSNPGANYWSQGAQVLLDVKQGDFMAGGGIGVATLNNKNYLFGDTWGLYNLNKNVSFDAGLSGDIVDSPLGLANGITYTGVSLGTDVHGTYGGVAFGGQQQYYSDGNVRSGGYAKAYVDVADGVNVYLKTKSFVDSQPYSPNYWDPGHYTRYSAGVGAKHRFDNNVVVSGFVEAGTQMADGVATPVHAARLSVDKVTDNAEGKGWTYGAAIGTDVNTAANYQYFYADVHAKYSF